MIIKQLEKTPLKTFVFIFFNLLKQRHDQQQHSHERNGHSDVACQETSELRRILCIYFHTPKRITEQKRVNCEDPDNKDDQKRPMTLK